ncbi:hypothetical protein Vadar_017241 [Vaccinium darrowii]|uniref:Uncharacterized protein n=1 Tax=Vaccinium darrowii TaxID=229202 RepID=A0ACB7Y0F3_9ERIC|nr:hypothetical protein Vadar_017241 [Vaccinium darrowii]
MGFSISDIRSRGWIAWICRVIKRMKIVGKKFGRLLEHVLDEHNARKNEEAGDFVAEEEEGMVEVGERENRPGYYLVDRDKVFLRERGRGTGMAIMPLDLIAMSL